MKKPRRRSKGPTTIVKFYPAPAGLPSEVKIRGLTFRIAYMSPIYHEGEALMGRVDYFERQILIDGTMTAHVMRETLLHEIAHVYMQDSDAPQGPLLEQICDIFASAWCDISDNNPRF